MTKKNSFLLPCLRARNVVLLLKGVEFQRKRNKRFKFTSHFRRTPKALRKPLLNIIFVICQS